VTHPLHPALVHFPIACWSLATAADFAGFVYGELLWRFAGALMAIGVLMALAAMATGMLEFIKLGDGHPAEDDVQRHLGWALAAWSCYAASVYLRWQDGQLMAPGMLALVLSALGFICLGVAGWLGGKLVYTHRVGGSA
jgi:uncharacterized membrane protein